MTVSTNIQAGAAGPHSDTPIGLGTLPTSAPDMESPCGRRHRLVVHEGRWAVAPLTKVGLLIFVGELRCDCFPTATTTFVYRRA